jgi:hypothetical protein
VIDRPTASAGGGKQGEQAFGALFGRWAGGVRRRMAASRGLTGAALGLVIGAAAAGALWKTGHGPLRPWAGAAGVLGACAGLAVGRRRRWGDEHVALYLDGRLGSGELVSTALELGKGGQRSGAAGEAEAGASDGSYEARAMVVTRATEVLEKGDPRRARLPVIRPWHAALPVAIAAIAYLSWLPLPRVQAAPPPPGADKVALAEIKGLEKAAKLGSLQTPDPEQKKRLEQIAHDAAALREKLKSGVERREALAEIARLQDAVQQERLSLGDGDRRKGLEAALSQLAQSPMTRDAAKALGDRDLVKFDEEMQKLANEREKADRDQAKKALEEAIAAAKKNGAEDVARALERQKQLLEERGKRADELRELGEALKGSLNEEDRKELEQHGNPGNDRDARKLAKAMEDALKKLTPEERKRLAEKLKQRAASNGMRPETAERMREMARELEGAEGQRKLEDELRDLANQETDDEDAERQEGLDGAQKGLGEAQGQLGAPVPIPMAGGPGKGSEPGAGKGEKGKGDGKGKGKGGDGDGAGNGSGEDTGTGDHKGRSNDVTAEEMRARAKAKLDMRAPSAGITIGRGAGRAGETANVQGTGALGQAGPAEVNGVDKSEVPEEYREQVGRYFQP